jgi:hypothetical protein
VLLACLLHVLLPRHRRFLGAGLHLNQLSRFRGPAHWYSDGFEIGCDNGRTGAHRLGLGLLRPRGDLWVATTGGIDSGDIRDLMIESIDRRGRVRQSRPK